MAIDPRNPLDDEELTASWFHPPAPSEQATLSRAAHDRRFAAGPYAIDTDELKLRLRLFRTVCDAAHYAHQRGVIHRDLKPSKFEDERCPGTLTRADRRAST